VVLTGVRWAESRVRRKRKFVDQCPSKAKVMVHPILDWSDEEVWDFIETEKLPYCSLYNEFKRIGCILCPSASQRVRLLEVERWPRFYRAYMNCFEEMLLERRRRKKPTKWKRAEDVMDWWLYEKHSEVTEDPDQPSFDIFE
jgi:phosphoadenosine phosphosulfate reductase